MYPTELHRRLDLRRMRRPSQRRRRDRHEHARGRAPSPRRTSRSSSEKPSSSITNGFDPADFAGPAPRRDDGTFRIVHTGYLHTADGLRLRKTRRLRRCSAGCTPTSTSSRAHTCICCRRSTACSRTTLARLTVELHLAGVLTEDDREVASPSPLVRMPGYLDTQSSLALVRSADLLFLPMHDLPPGTRAGLVPGKTYEYLASGRPILAAVPEGDARDLLCREPGARSSAARRTWTAMAAILSEQLERWRRGGAAPEPRREVVARFERPAQARLLAELFSDLLDR